VNFSATTVKYCIYRLVVLLVSRLPYSVILSLGRLCGRLYYLLIKKQVNLAKDTIKECLQVGA
jgi:lauroyl/myristoyl acyltransferase